MRSLISQFFAGFLLAVAFCPHSSAEEDEWLKPATPEEIKTTRDQLRQKIARFKEARDVNVLADGLQVGRIRAPLAYYLVDDLIDALIIKPDVMPYADAVLNPGLITASYRSLLRLRQEYPWVADYFNERLHKDQSLSDWQIAVLYQAAMWDNNKKFIPPMYMEFGTQQMLGASKLVKLGQLPGPDETDAPILYLHGKSGLTPELWARIDAPAKSKAAAAGQSTPGYTDTFSSWAARNGVKPNASNGRDSEAAEESMSKRFSHWPWAIALLAFAGLAWILLLKRRKRLP